MPQKENLTIPDKMKEWAEKYKTNTAVKFKEQSFTYEELYDTVNRLSRGLIEIGIKKGDKVCVWLPNGIDWIIADYSITSIGAILVPLNLRYTAREMEHVLGLADVSTIIMMDEFWKENCIEKLDEICPEVKAAEPGQINSQKLPMLKNLICISEQTYPGMYKYADILAHGEKWKHDDVLDRFKEAIQIDDVAKIFFTSGTTSYPKGVVLTHNLWRNLASQAEVMGYHEKDRFAQVVPTFYIMGNLQQILGPFLSGACVVPIEIIDPTLILSTIEKEKCTFVGGIPTLMMMLAEHPELEKYDLSSLRMGGAGGSALTTDLLRDLKQKLHIQDLTTGYGLTETTAVNMMTRPGDGLEIVASTIGKPLPGTQVRIIDPETGEELPDDTVGECTIKGHMVMKEYYKRPDETAKVIKDGWFHTGDLMLRRKDGYFEFKGRIKDIIRRGGENISVPEVEGVVGDHPKVAQAELVGIPDPRYEEVGIIFVRLKQGETCTEEEILEFCRERLAKYKVPQSVRFVNEFPLTATGKVQKYVLKEQYVKELS